ncbi:MAG: Ig-like domain-containing protein [Candidatus Limnocylindrales bacterium]
MTSLPLVAILMLIVAAPASAYNNANAFHVRLSQPQHVGCSEAAPLTATVTTNQGDPVPGITVAFSKHQGEAGDTLAPSTDVTDVNGDAESTYTIPCGAKSDARVIKACEPSGACATTVLVCRQEDGCTGDEAAAFGPIDGSAASAVAARGSTDEDDAGLILFGLFILTLLATGMIRRRPKVVRAATPA